MLKIVIYNRIAYKRKSHSKKYHQLLFEDYLTHQRMKQISENSKFHYKKKINIAKEAKKSSCNKCTDLWCEYINLIRFIPLQQYFYLAFRFLSDSQ